ncbi:MAG: TatD family hydrolase, partial [Treponemataceae bacterium]|nr:TatD family hydrolase [Treponemataceae bacterium]
MCSAAPAGASYSGCSCAHGREEFLEMERLAAAFRGGTGRTSDCPRLLLSFGLHPQAPRAEDGAFLEELLRSGRLDAVGEAGIDFFTPEFRADAARQEEAWRIQLELSAQYGKPLVIHCRKALDVMFRDARLLRNVPAAVFHSFCGGMNEARALLSRNVNAYFSFGKPLLNGSRRAAGCAASLPAGRLLLETDAPDVGQRRGR